MGSASDLLTSLFTAVGVGLVAIATAAAAVTDDVTTSREPHWLRSSHVTTAAPQQACYVHSYTTMHVHC